MCTVTYLPLGDQGFILTSSRDVPYIRKRALLPKNYIEDGVTLTFPKDGQAGGTWIGVSSKNRLLCVLNGGFKNHIPKDRYGQSRGLIVKNLLKVDDIFETLKNIDLSDIEPFTLVIVDWNSELRLAEFIWTGEEGHLTDLSQKPSIWSSTTLYSDETIKLRQKWFKEWLNSNDNYHQEKIINFHKTAGEGDGETNVLMKRKSGGTVSLTSYVKEREGSNLIYEDLFSQEVTIL